jgi:oxygen-independent coproporphyrinogen-3 oxidase
MNVIPKLLQSPHMESGHPAQVPVAAYVHVPFCIHRCGYCDFAVISGRDDLFGAYLDSLERELIHKVQQPRTVQTLFVGGGTPSYLPPAELESLLILLEKWFPRLSGAEFSMECNPDGLTDDRMKVMRSGGINRVSLGVQSFDRNHLTTLERTHQPEDVRDVVERLRKHDFGNISMDLIFGVPGQTLVDWQQTLEDAISLNPEHISTYGLTYEKGTSFWTRLQRDQLQAIPEETERAMYAETMETLPRAGYEQYELSNFSRPGFHCAHNRVYWRAEPFYGIGPGAAEFQNRTRTKNYQSVTGWIQRLQQGLSPVQEIDELSDDLAAREAVMVGLRQIQGIDLKGFEQRFQTSVHELAPDEYERLISDGLLEEVAGNLRLTYDGRFLADSVMSEFF